MNTIEQKAKEVIQELKLSVPISVEEIAKHYHIQIRKSPSNDFSGLLYRKEDNAFMAINSKESKVRQRFTIAHELGHFILHTNKITFVDFRDTPEQSNKSPKEREANQFAASLLMPKHLLERDVKALNVSSISEHEVFFLAERYNVSKEAMTYRLLNLNLSSITE